MTFWNIVTKNTDGHLNQRGSRSSSVIVQCVRVDVSLQDGQQRTYDEADIKVHFSSSEGMRMNHLTYQDKGPILISSFHRSRLILSQTRARHANGAYGAGSRTAQEGGDH